jgi:hypothetical protein
MWPFNKAQRTVTSEEFAAALQELMRRSAQDFCAELQKEAQEKWTLDADEIATAGTQIFIAYLWMVSKILAADKRVLDLLHEGYFWGYYRSGATLEDGSALANGAQSDLLARYERYYKAWEDDMNSTGGLALGSEMCQFFFPKRRPVLDVFLQYSVQVRVAAFMTTALQFRQRYVIVGT